MKTFLKEVASEIVASHSQLNNVVCIIPSERAAVYLRDALKQELIGKSTFLPKIVSVENFIKELSGYESLDQVSLIFEFYKVYRSSFKRGQPDSFERFIGWATIAIQDFNEIDRHLVDAKELFSYLTDIQNIKDWSPGKDEETGTVKNYMSFVKDLYNYYLDFVTVLRGKKAAYQGLIYREAFKNHKKYIEKHANKSFHFIGFNALNKAEEGIFKSFLSIDKNQVYWDVDAYYFNGNHEAGTFTREFFNNWTCLEDEHRRNWIHNHFQEKKNIQILGAPLNVTGVKGATSFLKNELNPEETAMVLAEETLLPVVLNSIPEEVKRVNITMGYSLGNIPLASLFQSLFDLQLNKQKLGKEAFYYKDIISVLRHSYIQQIDGEACTNVVGAITKNNLVFISEGEIVKFLSEHNVKEVVVDLFKVENKIANFLSKTIGFIYYLQEQFKGIDLLYVEGFRKVFQEILNLNTKYEYIESFKVLAKVFNRLLSLETVDFKGDALGGMQLMGVLETRCLDFKNVIMTSVNEGVLPSGKSEQSFISFEVKRYFNMPTYLAKDAIFSYHFYRLLQRAENIYLLYNTQMDDFGGGEMSRFLTRLLIDKEEQVSHKRIGAKIAKNYQEAREIKKTEDVLKVLFSYFQKGASPSRIIEYINDPLEFYHKMVLKIRETDKVEEEVAHNTLGTVVHDSLEFLYQPYLGKVLLEQDILKMKSLAEAMVSEKFKEYFKDGDITTGKNRLISEVAKQFVFNFLNLELAQIKEGKEIIVKELEKECDVAFTTPKGHQIKLKGKIDRVDEVDGVLRIVDYKTGKVEARDLRLADTSLAITDFKYHKIVQVLIYVLMYADKENIDLEKRKLQTGIYSFKNLKSGFLAMNFADSAFKKEYLVTHESLTLFKESLLQLVDDILDSNLNFVENIDRKYKKEA